MADRHTNKTKDGKKDSLTDTDIPTERQIDKKISDFSVSLYPFLNFWTHRHKMDTELENMLYPGLNINYFHSTMTSSIVA